MSDKHDQHVAKVHVAGQTVDILVPITSVDKPHVPDELTVKWQHILDLAARLIHVPAGLIMQLHEHDIEVFLASQTAENPYHQHETASLQTGLYCETVVGTRRDLMVPNALTDPLWDQNPDIALQMVSYFGVPIRWPDGEVFGTFCVLNREEHHYASMHQELIHQFREMIEIDLKLLTLNHQLQRHAALKELQLREIHHRVKNHFNLLLSSLSLQTMYASPENTLEGILADIHARISAIANIHQKLYQSDDLEHMSLRAYLQQVGQQIVDNCAQGTVAYHCEADEIPVTPEVSVPCGLLLSEWITNSVKYAFETIESPKITVQISRLSSGEVTVRYRDNVRNGVKSVLDSFWDIG